MPVAIQTYNRKDGFELKLKNKWDNESREIAKKVQERRLKWYGHVMRRKELCVGRSDGNESIREDEERKA